MRLAALHAGGRNFETGAGRVVNVHQFSDRGSSDFAGPQSRKSKAQRGRHGPAAVEGMP